MYKNKDRDIYSKNSFKSTVQDSAKGFLNNQGNYFIETTINIKISLVKTVLEPQIFSAKTHRNQFFSTTAKN